MLNIHTQHKFKYAHQQILFFKRLFNVKLIYSIQVLGPWLWGNRPLFFLSGGAEEGAQWGKSPLHGIKKCIAGKSIFKLVKLQSLVVNCCKMRKIWPCEIHKFCIYLHYTRTK